jgi:anti-sigma regulatory factor (Ser/Thr protein kinase)
VEDRAVDGLGLLLVRALFDAVDYARNGEQNVLVLTKNL